MVISYTVMLKDYPVQKYPKLLGLRVIIYNNVQNY